MTKTELIERMTRLSQRHFTQVAEPQFYGGEGPFLFAMDESDGPPKFFCRRRRVSRAAGIVARRLGLPGTNPAVVRGMHGCV
jgi:hypothetical protein